MKPGINLRKGEVLVHVETYEVPTFEELQKQFDWVWDSHGSPRWQDHKVCKDISRESGDRIMLVRHFAALYVWSEDVFTWAKANGYRPATRAEAIAYAKANPAAQRKCPIVVLGTLLPWSPTPTVAVLLGNVGARFFDCGDFESSWHTSEGFLLVRE